MYYTETDTVNKLVNELADLLSSARSQREVAEGIAKEVLEAQKEKMQVLIKYVDNDSIEQELENGVANDENSTIYGGSEEDEEVGGIKQVQRQNIKLKVDAQRLEEVDDRYTDLLSDYQKAIENIMNEANSIANESSTSAENLISSYAKRLEEEKRTHDIFVVGYEDLTRALSELHRSLVATSTSLDKASTIEG